MSDKIYILAENASPAARIQSPFGAIATDVSGSVSAEAVMKNAGLNWRVSKEELFLADKTKITDHVAIRRDDTKGVLGVVGSGYEPLQNVEAFAFADNLVSQGAMEYVGAGMFEDGKRIFIQAKLNRPDVDGEGGIGLAEVVPGDAIQPYFFFANGHDGGLSVHVQMVNIRVVCGNTFAMAIEQGKKTKNRRAGTAVTLRHTKNVSERLEETQEMLKWAGLEFTKFIGAARKLTKKDVPTGIVKTMFDKIFEIDADDTLSLKAKNRAERLMELFVTGAGNDLKGVRGTAWAAVNAVTEYLTHEASTNVRGVSKDISEADHARKMAAKRAESNLLGNNRTIADRAMALALAL